MASERTTTIRSGIWRKTARESCQAKSTVGCRFAKTFSLDGRSALGRREPSACAALCIKPLATCELTVRARTRWPNSTRRAPSSARPAAGTPGRTALQYSFKTNNPSSEKRRATRPRSTRTHRRRHDGEPLVRLTCSDRCARRIRPSTVTRTTGPIRTSTASLVPVKLKARYRGQLDPDPDHHFPSVDRQIFNDDPNRQANMRGFVRNYYDQMQDAKHAAQIMYAFKPEQLPVLTKLAQQFAVFNAWFSSIPGPTLCNRAFAHYGTSFGQAGMEWLVRDAAGAKHLRPPGRRRRIRQGLLLRPAKFDARGAQPPQESANGVRHLSGVSAIMRRRLVAKLLVHRTELLGPRR